MLRTYWKVGRPAVPSGKLGLCFTPNISCDNIQRPLLFLEVKNATHPDICLLIFVAF